MSDKIVTYRENHNKLQIQHKLFAAIERMIKETRVFPIDLEQPASVSGTNLEINAGQHSLPMDIPAAITGIPVTINTPTHEIVETLTNPPVHDAGAHAIDTPVNDVPTALLTTVDVHNVPVRLNTRVPVNDFLKEYDIKPHVHYSTPAKSIDIKALTAITKTIPTVMTHRLKENTVAFRRVTVTHPPVELSYLTEKEQLVFWKKAVEKTRKEPRKLQLIGVYTAIAYDCIENLKINLHQRRLNYTFKTQIPRDRGQLRDIALFKDLETEKSVMVRK